MKKIVYAVVGKKGKIIGYGKKEREVLSSEHIIYASAPGSEGGCDCCYTEDVYWIFPTKKEALQHAVWPPFPYTSDNCRVVAIKAQIV